MDSKRNNGNEIFLGFCVFAAMALLFGHSMVNDCSSKRDELSRELENVNKEFAKLKSEYDGYQKGRR